MEIKDIRKLNIEGLNEKLTELRNKSRELRFSITNNQLKNVRDLRNLKKDIAKILTILNQKRSSSENMAEDKVKDVKESK